VLVLPQTAKDRALQVVQRLKELLSASPLAAGEGVDVRVTASFGISTYPEDGDTRKALIARADGAMYAAKHNGRNKIELAPGREEPAASGVPTTS
jgi:diguanylate cyclase (GGDEF)-like protein